MNLSSKIQMITGGNKQAATFLLFVLLSAVIWTINALSKDQITTIHIPITYPGEQSQELQSGLPHELIFNAKGKGFFLMQFMTKTENFRIVPKSISNPLRDTVISSLQALAPVLEDFQGKIEIRNLQPEQLLLSGRKMFSKKVAIQPRFRATYLPAFVQKGPAITQPDSILLFSTAPIPDTLVRISTIINEATGLDKTLFRRTRLELPNGNFHVAQNDIWFLLPVEKGTEITLEVPIKNNRIFQHESFIPSTVKLTCRVPLSRFHQTKAENFLLLPTQPSIDGEKMLIEVIKAPYWASSIRIEPGVVNRIITEGR